MASSEDQPQNSNPAPPSLSAGGHEMHDSYAPQDGPQPLLQQEPYLTPYLGLRARLSQTWINRWTVLLLLVLIRTLIALASVDDNLGKARQEALSGCTSVENVGSAMASMPHYMSQGVNELTAQGVEKAINGLMEMLILSITAVEEIVLFVINLMTSTYVCLITLAVGGSLHVAVQVAEDVGNILNSTVQGVSKDIGDALGDFQSTLDGFLKDINDASNFLTGDHKQPPTIDLSSEINQLNTLQLPTGYDQGLATLNGSIPTFAQVHNFTNHAIMFPFEEVKKLLNESLPKYTMNGSLFPVPAKQQLTFCSDDNGINDFFDDMVDIELMAKKIFLAVIIILAFLAMIPMAWLEMRRYRFQKERAQLIKSDAFDPMDAVYIATRPYTSSAGLKLADKFKSNRRQTLIRWIVAYATTPPALFILSIGIASLLACLCQYLLLKAIEKEVPILENQVIGFADKVIDKLNNASEQWAIGSNALIIDMNTKINQDIFGWVNTTTSAVNNTLNVFVDDMVIALNDTFGGTVLYDPILGVLNCLVLLKIQGVENGLTWISDHAHLDFPLLPNNTFSLGTIEKVSGSEADILATGTNGGAATAITAGMFHVTNALEKAVRQEAIIAACVLIVWIIIALIGIARAVFLLFKGGHVGVYQGPQPTNRGISMADWPNSTEKREQNTTTTYSPPTTGTQEHELNDFLRKDPTWVPSYEQATRDPAAEPADNDNGANKYRGQTYTLQPRPLPTTTEVRSTATSPIFHTGFRPPNEKVGVVNGQNVDAAIRRPTHLRASSHGDYAITSPISATAKYSANPFADTNSLQVPADR